MRPIVKSTICLLASVILLTITSCNNMLNPQSEKSQIEFDDKTMVSADTTGLSSEILDRLQRIAEILAVRYVNERASSETVIAEEIVSYFYNGLVHFYKSDSPEAKEMTSNYTLMAHAPGNPREVLLWADKSMSWVDNWRNGETKTGIAEIDALLEKFDLRLERYREFSVTEPGAVAEMQSPKPINVYAVGKAFSRQKEIKKAGPDGYLTGGRNVKGTVKENHLLLDVTVGSGDCPSGCINKINHQFRIYSDGRVELEK